MTFKSLSQIALLTLVFLIINAIAYFHFSYVQKVDILFLALSTICFFLHIYTFHPTFKKIPKLLLNLLMILSVCISLVYFLGNFFTGKGIDYAVLNHFSLDSLEAGTYSFSRYHLGLIVMLAIYGIAFFICRKKSIKPFKWQLIFSIILGALSVTLHPGSRDIINLWHLVSENSPDEKLVQIYEQGYVSDQLVQKIKNESENFPNVLLIFLEGIEKTYLDPDIFPSLAENINRLEKSGHSYSNVKPVFGASHTISGLVSSLCGIPFAKMGGGNYQHGDGSVYMPKAQCLGDITKALGYQNLYYQGARLSFSRKGSFFRAHGYDEVKGLKYLKNITPNHAEHVGTWGMNDDVLFDTVLQKLRELKGDKKAPFLMTVLNLDTHDTFAKNYISKRCKNDNQANYLQGDHIIQSAVHCVDYLLQNFLKEVTEEWGDDLEVYLVSDHIAPSHALGKRLVNTPIEDRKLIFAHLTGKKSESSQRLTNFDIAPTILSQITNSKIQRLGLGVSEGSGQTTLREIDGIEKLNKRISKSINRFASLVWKYPSFNENDITVNVKEKKLEIDKDTFKFPVALILDDKGEILDFYNTHIHLSLALKKVSPRVVYINTCKELNRLIDEKSGQEKPIAYGGYCILAGNLGAENIRISALKSDTKLSYKDMEGQLNSKFTLAKYNSRIYDTNHLFYKEAKMFSYGSDNIAPMAKIEFMSRAQSKHRYVTSHIFLKSIKQKSKYRHYGQLESGLHLFSVSGGLVTHLSKWDDCEPNSGAKPLVKFLKKRKAFDYVVLSSGKGVCKSGSFNYFKDTPFDKDISSLKPNTPYVGYYNLNSGKFYSKQADPGSEVVFSLVNNTLYLRD